MSSPFIIITGGGGGDDDDYYRVVVGALWFEAHWHVDFNNNRVLCNQEVL